MSRAGGAARPRYAEEVQAFYRAEVERHGHNFRGLGYNHRTSQVRRFEVLAQVGDLDGARVLDVGAGLGDFLVHLWSLGIECDYTGLDICDHLVRAARARFAAGRPRRPRFVTGDVLDHAGEYDYVIASGIFGLRTAETLARVAPTLARLFALCRRAVAVNFLSARAPRHAARSAYFEPTDILGEALRLTPAVTLRHDYLPNDFTLFLYRDARWPTRVD